MIDFVLQFDKQLFHIINYQWANPFFDLLMPWLRNKIIWTPLYLFLIVFLILNYPKHWWKILLLLGLSIFAADQLSSSIIKPLMQRDRPCHDLIQHPHFRLLLNCRTGFSFPSAHASNHFAIAAFFYAFYQNKYIGFVSFFWAGIISFAQIYVGLHFPLDILGGMLLGLLIGLKTGKFARHLN